MNTELSQYFLSIYNKEKEYLTEIKSGNFEISYPFGYFIEIFLAKETIMCNHIIPIIGKIIHNKSFKKEIIRITLDNYKKERELYLQRDKENKELSRKDPITTIRLKSIEERISNLEFSVLIDEFINIFSDTLVNTTEVKNDFAYFKNNFINAFMAEIIYNNFRTTKESKQRFIVLEDTPLEKLYMENGVNLKEVDKQFKKYKLLSINEDVTIIPSNMKKVYDKRIDSYVFIKEIDADFLMFLNSLIDNGFIKYLALRPEYDQYKKIKKNISMAMEEVERGSIFIFKNLGVPNVSKLYSNKNYNNCLWIHNDGKNITFEELLDDFQVDSDNIVTQVIHLEYFQDINDEKNSYIAHIDHEFIFYTEDEYNQRLTDYLQKGSAKQRFKTFKIDCSHIPFQINNVPFLYTILDQHFNNKDLLLEYFEECLK
jgi:hypothetical protein